MRSLRSPLRSFPGLAALSLMLASTAASQEGAPLDAAALFVTNCATCHGVNGDGQGVTELDRQARSFKDGGFSFGNTPEALFRTITSGIPGTPMPAFDSSLSADERRAIADYVVTLGPPVEAVDPDSTILRVVDRPRIVRGYLPPIAGGAKAWPRGLLIGDTSGMTFQYRVDDVRLLGVRQGEFVQRKDWVGRGGAALEPLGKVVMLVEEGMPRATFEYADGGRMLPLQARLAGTWVRGERAGLTYGLFTAHGDHVASVEETCHSVGTSVGSGFRRELRFFDIPRTVHISLRAHVYGERQDVSRFGSLAGGAATLWTVWPRGGEDAGTMQECVGIALPLGGSPPDHLQGVVGLPLELRAKQEVTTSITKLVLTEWTDATHQRLAEELR